MDQGLLVSPLVVLHLSRRLELCFEQSFADPGYVAVAEDAEAAFDHPVLYPVTFAPLVGQEADYRLAYRQAHGSHGAFLVDPMDSVKGACDSPAIERRGSTGLPDQLSRTHAWCGSSIASQERSPGPAMTFR